MNEETTANNESTTTKRHKSASVSARVVYALTPMIRMVEEWAESDYAFMNQMDTRLLGCYLLPAEKGVVLCVVHSGALIAVLDPDGHSTEQLKVTFPDGLLDVLVPRTIKLANENGIPFEVEIEPHADRVLCAEGFGIVFLNKEQSEKYEGCLGTWFNKDHGNVIDLASYRLDSVDASFLAKAVNRPATGDAPLSTAALNPYLLEPISQAATRLGAVLQFSLSKAGEAITFRSSDDDTVYGLLMPMDKEERGPSPLVDVIVSRPKAATAAG